MTKTAIQGEDGSNSAAAARSLLGDDVSLLYCDSFQDAFTALENGTAVRAVLPVENTTAGIIQEVWDRLLGITAGRKLVARAEARIRIGFVAAALPGARGKVKKILAHPVARAQCRKFLAESGWEIVTCHDTAGAARLVREGNDLSVAALCPLPAALVYRLEILDPDCGDSSRTWTRFFLIEPGENGEPAPTPSDDRSILIFALKDTPGALVKTLSAFSSQGLNLAAIHSRAVPGSPGQYRFFVELNVGANDPRCLTALREVAGTTSEVQILGSYTTPPWPEQMPTR